MCDLIIFWNTKSHVLGVALDNSTEVMDGMDDCLELTLTFPCSTLQCHYHASPRDTSCMSEMCVCLELYLPS